MSVVDDDHALDQSVAVELEYIDTLEAHGGTVFQHPVVDKIARRTQNADCAVADVDKRNRALSRVDLLRR
jgi:hypothetical protein